LKFLLHLSIFISALSFNSFSKDNSIQDRINGLKSVEKIITTQMATEVLNIIKIENEDSVMAQKIDAKRLEKLTDPLILNSLINSLNNPESIKLQKIENAAARVIIKSFSKL